MLNFGIDGDDLPFQMQGLVGGLEEPLQGHHFGIEVNQIDPTTATIEESSLFGLMRNKDLVSNCETNPDFIYRTPNISFPNTLTPYLEYAKPFSIDDNIRFPGTDLPTKLAGFFEKLFASEGAANRSGAPQSGQAGAIPHLIKLEASHQYPLAETAGEALNTRLPLRLIDGYSFNADDATLGDGTFVSELARSLATWYRGSRPATDQAKLSFDLTVFVNFDTQSRKLPLFRLMQVQLSVESSDSWWGPAAPVEE